MPKTVQPCQPGPDALRLPMVSVLFMAVAAADYWTGYELWFSIFYLAFIGWGTWFYGRWAGIGVAAASVAFSLLGDLASGARYSSAFVPWWNMLISLSFYLAMVLVLTRLRASQQGLEQLVHERTAALRAEMTERVRLESALLGVSEREQRRIGHELHDSLCQHLTGTALAAQVLSGELAGRGIEEARKADHLVTLIEDGIDLSRSLARGLAPLELDAEGLAEALRELAAVTTAAGQVKCQVLVQASLTVNYSESATQLFRIAQEAVRNALKHAAATLITIRLEQNEKGVSLVVEDDGNGLPDSWMNREGMGMRIMRYRATMVGAEFSVRRLERGTQVSVRSPLIEKA